MKRKSILIITLHADPFMPPGVGEWGGTHTYMKELLLELADEAYKVLLITRKVFDSQQDKQVLNPYCSVHRIKIGDYGIFDKRTLHSHHEYVKEQIKNIITKEGTQFDIIHSVYWNSGYQASQLSEELGIPYVHSVISNAKGRILRGATGTAEHREKIEKIVYTNARYIICVAESERQELSDLYAIKPEKIIVAGQYVHTSFRNPAHNEYGYPRQPIVLSANEEGYFVPLVEKSMKGDLQNWAWWEKKNFTYVGRICKDKGVDIIIETWYRLFLKYGDTCPCLWLVGGSTDEIQSFRNGLNMPSTILADIEKQGKIIWWGYLDEAGISAIYTKTLILITHSLYEPGGRVAVEAMSSGVPVIASPNGFALDIIEDWENGFMVPFQDSDKLLLRMEHFVKQPYLSNILGQQAKSIGRQIIKTWGFKNSHISAYESAMGNLSALENMRSFHKQRSNTLSRQIKMAPYNEILANNTDIAKMFEEHGYSINSVKKIEINASSHIWIVEDADSEYFVKIPYDKLNLNSIWEEYQQSELVITSDSRYRSEIASLDLQEIEPVLFYDSTLEAIVRKNCTSCDRPHEIKVIIDKLERFYRNSADDYIPVMERVDYMIKNGSEYKIIDDMYTKEVSRIRNIWNYFRDYSLRVERLRWNKFFHNNIGHMSKEFASLYTETFSLLSTIAPMEVHEKIVLNHGGMDIKNLIFTGLDVPLLDNEKIHPGWVGCDLSDILVTYSRKYAKSESTEWWANLLREISPEIISLKILIGWLLLSIHKEGISAQVQIKPIENNLIERANALMNIYKKLP